MSTPIPKDLYGWGFNDTCMAVKMIAYGSKIIPNLNSTILHILEKKHTKSNELKNKDNELKNKENNNYCASPSTNNSVFISAPMV